ncbi:sulfatase-like hydrolase/transferase [Mycobacterium sp. djl-10]|uniref:sulfatase-like hydrolase/transferase n=1 Tax=Mycolicibacterium sp. D5.8-2 TaxID=3085903 RepID=UPI00296E3515
MLLTERGCRVGHREPCSTEGRRECGRHPARDLGFGQLGCYGSDIATPAIDRLARNGLRYNGFHVTGLCSPSGSHC